MSDDCDSPLNSKVDGDNLVLYLAYDAASAYELQAADEQPPPQRHRDTPRL